MRWIKIYEQHGPFKLIIELEVNKLYKSDHTILLLLRRIAPVLFKSLILLTGYHHHHPRCHNESQPSNVVNDSLKFWCELLLCHRAEFLSQIRRIMTLFIRARSSFQGGRDITRATQKTKTASQRMTSYDFTSANKSQSRPTEARNWILLQPVAISPLPCDHTTADKDL